MISFPGRWVWTLVALGAVAGCAADAGSGRDPDATEEAAQGVSERDVGERADGPGRRGPPRGPELLLVAALHDLELTDAQKTSIEAALAKVEAGRKQRGPKDGGAFAVIARGVRAGKIDAAAVLAEADGPGRDTPEHLAVAEEALRTLHATLSKEQRRALVDAIAAHKDRGPGRGAKGGDAKEGEGPHGRGPDHDGPRGPKGKGGPLGHLLGGLDLTEAQEEAIERSLPREKAQPDRAAMKERSEAFRAEMRARLETFAADTFDAKAFVTPPAGARAHDPKERLEHMVADLSAVLPILDAAQREKLAARLEMGPPDHSRRGPRAAGRAPRDAN